MSGQDSADRIRLGATFQHAGVAAAYAARPPYPEEIFDLLLDLLDAASPRILDLGAGDGALARPLAGRVAHVDAVEPSAAMIRAGRLRPGGDRKTLEWHLESAESTQVSGPYGLITAGASLHWMDGPAVLTTIAELLSPAGVFAAVDQTYTSLPWAERLRPVIVEHSRSPRYRADDIAVERLAAQGDLQIKGRHHTGPISVPQTVTDYVEQFFSTASLARELMAPHEARRFAEQVTTIVAPYADADGMLPTRTICSVVWGHPIPHIPQQP